ncbi:MAG: rhodanese-like domain-containing protein [Gammaproteobacteria bacterium]|jgi:rhodanese-related sulfurtransferase
MAQFIEFAGNHVFLFTAAAALIALIAVGEIRRLNRPFKAAAPMEAVRLMNQGALVVDIRDPARFREGHLTGARNVPMAELADKAEELTGDQGRPILVYCASGQTTARAAALLAGRHPAVYELKGGVDGWKRDNLPLVKD